ncbi:MAG: response regulator transcription factor [Dehalococcoidia bacterium]|nr:response regulator transcription factor [Dehalococcoidia bacterium]
MIVDDHEVVRQGLKTLLERRERLAVVAEAGSVQEAVREALRTEPDVIVMDVRLPDGTGVEACREIRSHLPRTNVLMITSYSDDRAVMAALLAGAGGFMLKDVRSADLVEAMRIVGRGGKILDAASSAAVIEQLRRGTFLSEEEKLARQLSERELQIIDLIAEGLTNREIGERLYLSEKTVKHHISEILAKLGFTRRSEIAAFAARLAAQKQRQD